jgi:hypothetical protein
MRLLNMPELARPVRRTQTTTAVTAASLTCRIAGVACARTYAELCITFHDSASTFTSLWQLLRNLLRRRIELDRRLGI